MITLKHVQELEEKFNDEVSGARFASYYEAPKINWGALWIEETPAAYYLIKNDDGIKIYFIGLNGNVIKSKVINNSEIVAVKYGSRYFGLKSGKPILNIEYKEDYSVRVLQILESEFGKSLDELKVAME